MNRCNRWFGITRCERDAVGVLHGPDGEMVPGGWYCEFCALATVEEYATKLGERWEFRQPVPPTA